MDVGRVMWFNEANGFGFIKDDDGREVYFHYTAIVNSETKKSIPGGALVYFDLFQTSIGWEASNVRFE